MFPRCENRVTVRQVSKVACANNGIVTDHMDMGISVANFAHESPAPTPAVADVIDAVESAETEFWDEGWTLEDEWEPKATLRSSARIRPPQTHRSPDVYVLL